MKKITYYVAKIKGRLLRSHECLNDYYRKKGVKIGKGCLMCSNPVTKEPNLVEIGENTTISTGVTFITHDNSIKLLFPEKTDVFGKIKIGNNCFIGQNTTIMYGVTIADNVIVAAGSVITKSIIETNIIVGGNPARKLSDWTDFKEKMRSKAICRRELNELLLKDDSFLVNR